MESLRKHDFGSEDLWPRVSLAQWQAAPDRAFEDWLANLVVATGRGTAQLRDSSVEVYRAMFNTWLAHLRQLRCGFLEASASEAQHFFAMRDFDSHTRRRYLQLFDRVYRSLAKAGWAGYSPFRQELSREQPLDERALNVLSEHEQQLLWDCLANKHLYAHLRGGATANLWRLERDRAMLAALLGAGLRSNELRDLRWAHVNPDPAASGDYSIRVVPAGVHRNHTTLVLPGPARLAWESWVAARGSRGIPGEHVFAATKAGKPMSSATVLHCVIRWIEAAGLDMGSRPKGPGILRSTFARNALQRVDFVQVVEFLGHEDVRSTARYASAQMALEIPELARHQLMMPRPLPA